MYQIRVRFVQAPLQANPNKPLVNWNKSTTKRKIAYQEHNLSCSHNESKWRPQKTQIIMTINYTGFILMRLSTCKSSNRVRLIEIPWLVAPLGPQPGQSVGGLWVKNSPLCHGPREHLIVIVWYEIYAIESTFSYVNGRNHRSRRGRPEEIPFYDDLLGCCLLILKYDTAFCVRRTVPQLMPSNGIYQCLLQLNGVFKIITRRRRLLDANVPLQLDHHHHLILWLFFSHPCLHLTSEFWISWETGITTPFSIIFNQRGCYSCSPPRRSSDPPRNR